MCYLCCRLVLSESLISYNPLELAAAIEVKSIHPFADAIVSEFSGCIAEMEGDFLPTQKIKVIDGLGIQGMVEDNGSWFEVVIGSERVLRSKGGKVVLSEAQSKAYEDFVTRNTGSSVVLITVDGFVEVALAIRDEIREEAKEFVRRTSALGVPVTMLTGDLQSVGESVCRDIGIDPLNCKARLLPQEKMAWIENEQQHLGRAVVMVGDGINDAIALSLACVGIAMGDGGSAMAIDAGDVVVMSDNLLRIPSAIELCRRARDVILQNCVFAIAVKIIAVVLAIMGYLSLWAAVLIDLGTLLIVILNGMTPLRYDTFDNSGINGFISDGSV